MPGGGDWLIIVARTSQEQTIEQGDEDEGEAEDAYHGGANREIELGGEE